MAVLFTIMANAKRHHLEPFAYVRDLLVKMSSLCAACGVVIPDFTEVSVHGGSAMHRELEDCSRQGDLGSLRYPSRCLYFSHYFISVPSGSRRKSVPKAGPMH